jgi:glycosyltransferase involved in cell wall biosynthesis
VHKVICSSRSEAEYYCSVFGWKPDKACFVPFHTNPRFVSQTDVAEDSHYLLAAGRTFRDYDCAIEAIKGTPFKLVIVGGAGSAFMAKRVDQVQIFEEVSLERLTELMAHCVAVVVPLLDRKISTGQSIFLQAMALGKPVIATRTSGTADYFEHMVTGILVDPGDVESLRSAMHLMVDHDVRRRIGQRAQEAVRSRYLPHHYTAAVREVLTG